MTGGWRWSDAWFFEAVAWAEGTEGADLAGILGAGDAVNHAVFTLVEVEGAVHRLTGAGLLEEVARRFTLTARGHALRRPAAGHAVHDRMKWLELQLRRFPLPVGEAAWRPGPEEWRSAVDGHVRRFATERRLSGRGGA